jgi:hypothetical protein
MITKSELAEVSRISREIKMWDKELENIKNKSIVKAQRLTGLPFGGECSDKVGETATDIVMYQKLVMELIGKLEEKRAKIIEFIVTVDDTIMRQILYLRCIECNDWVDIGIKLGYDFKYVRNKYYKFLKDNEIT